MTKEELYQSIAYPNNVSISNVSITNYLNEFFESNVCIPKGENIETNILDMKKWVGIPSNQWRIKPLELVYEYKWYIGNMYGIDAVTEQFHTEEEIEGKPFRKMRETKRERK